MTTLGMLLRDMGPGHLQDALLVLRKACQACPEDANMWWNLGTTCYMADLPDDAVDAYTRACDAAGGNWEGIAPILNNLATMLMDQVGRLGERMMMHAGGAVRSIRTTRGCIQRGGAKLLGGLLPGKGGGSGLL